MMLVPAAELDIPVGVPKTSHYNVYSLVGKVAFSDSRFPGSYCMTPEELIALRDFLNEMTNDHTRWPDQNGLIYQPLYPQDTQSN